MIDFELIYFKTYQEREFWVEFKGMEDKSRRKGRSTVYNTFIVTQFIF